ncbi:MAG: PAS domain-containing protein [Gammaproteobacteria bacterium]|nr:PAS domain-containing protein [Gammaproteobacteria bacterium]
MLSLVADHANSGIVITDANGKIEYLNAGFEKLAGYGLEEARGKKPGPMLQGIATLVGETNQRVEALAASLAKIDG